MVGIDWIPNRAAVARAASVSTFANTTWPASSWAAAAKWGAIIRHGPHQAAQKVDARQRGLADDAVERVVAEIDRPAQQWTAAGRAHRTVAEAPTRQPIQGRARRTRQHEVAHPRTLASCKLAREVASTPLQRRRLRSPAGNSHGEVGLDEPDA